MALPTVIYIYEDEERDGSKYFVASKDPGEQTEGLIGVYRLEESLHVRHPLEFRRPGTNQWFKSSLKMKK